MAVISSSAVGFRNLAYNMFFKRTSTTLAFVLGGAIAGEYALHSVFDQLWENANKGKLAHHQQWYNKP
eukprot:CAMPEP_0179443162 /NCGR_PEP_ID=MMETSP0799-20121207/26571_1 /TAXON_ID=46947 /ORGANISM="Geminigera cryophila, Strain CCMP2564" /LENGTH=67 /DNA_ID=CAMNT_0021228855 /DNA_START=106 /DNA_END=309 /DNA_ORIENTATION=-